MAVPEVRVFEPHTRGLILVDRTSQM